MPTEVSADVETINDLYGDDRQLADGVDISTGNEVTDDIANVSSFTIYLSAGSSVDVTIELSPDGGSNWYTPEGMPISIDGSTDGIARFEYDANAVRLSGSNNTQVTAQVREVI